MADPPDINVLSESGEQLKTEVINSKESMNSAVNTSMSRIDEVQQGTTIHYNTIQVNTIQYNLITPTPNAAAATPQGSLESSNSEGNGSVLQAARAGRWDKVNYLLERGFSATDCPWPSECALALAARADQVDAVRRLLRRGAASQAEQVQWGLMKAKSAAVVRVFGEEVPVAVRGEAGEWAMRTAASLGRLELLAALLDQGVYVNCKNLQGKTALMQASWNGHIACVKELLRRGADVSIQDEEGWTALHEAANEGREGCVRALLEAGASRTVKTIYGETPLEMTNSHDIRQLLYTVH